MSEIEFAVLNDKDRVTTQSALKLQELVKERLNPKLHTCYEGCTKCINFHYLQSLLEESEK